MRLTDKRKALLNLLSVSDVPLTARDLYEQTQPHPDLSTVYRALEVLEKEHYIHSVLLFSGERYYYHGRKHGHFLVCHSCHEIIPFEHCHASAMEQEMEQKYGYHIDQHILTFEGECGRCRAAGSV